ncbi:Protein of unknown function [Bacillus mycoides]|nr:Protein of unknown function [Bacillus mycoides]
MPRPIGEG